MPLDNIKDTIIIPDDLTAEQKWRLDIIEINLRINGKICSQPFNRSMDLDLNLIFYLVKFLKLPPETATRVVYFKKYCLRHETESIVLQEPTALRLI